MTFLVVLTLFMAALAPASASASDNMEVVAHHPYTGGTELAFDGRYVYAAQWSGTTNRNNRPDQGGILIFDPAELAAGRSEPVGFVPCPGTDNYVSAVRPGLIAVSHHNSRCNRMTRGDGMYLVDVSDPASPVVLGGIPVSSGHTLTVHPGGDYIYVSPGGLPGNGDHLEYVVDVRNPKVPRVVNRFRGGVAGCHDLGFDAEGHYAYCAGGGEISTWDVSDPVSPIVLSRITNPAIQFPHNAVVSPDGTKLVVNDEAFGLHECETGTSLYGSLWIYDIRVPAAPVLVGRIAPRSVGNGLGTYSGWTQSWCAAHNYNFIPGTDIVVSSWFSGGVTVHDISNPLQPVELGHYEPRDGIAYTAHFYDGHVYVNDLQQGLRVLRVDGLPEPGQAAAWARGPRTDRTPQLIPKVLPPRAAPPAVRSITTSGFCVIPGLSSPL